MSANENYVYGAKKKLFSINNSNFVNEFKSHLKNSIKNSNKEYKEILLLCIGTDRSTGDSFAPLMGTILSKNKNRTYKILGTLENPVHAKNLEETIKNIDKENTLIIAIDACLGEMDNVGKIQLSEGGLKPGSGVGKEHLPIVGDISIAGIVNFGGYMDFLVLQNTRLHTVYFMAETTGKCINQAICELNKFSVFDIVINKIKGLYTNIKVVFQN